MLEADPHANDALPESSVAESQANPVRRPTSWLALGIIGICFAALSLLSQAVLALLPDDPPDPDDDTGIDAAIAFVDHDALAFSLDIAMTVSAVALFIIAIALIRFRPWARPAARVYALIDLPLCIAACIYPPVLIQMHLKPGSSDELSFFITFIWIAFGIALLVSIALPICFLTLLRRDPRLHPESVATGTSHEGDAANPYRAPRE